MRSRCHNLIRLAVVALILAVTLLAQAPDPATGVFVAAPAAGSSFTCTSTIAAGASISAAVTAVASGGTVCLGAGNYPAGYNATITKASMTTVRAAAGLTPSQVTLSTIQLGGSQNLTFRGMTVAGGETGSGTPSIHIVLTHIIFTAPFAIYTPTNINNDITLEYSSFDNMGTSCNEGRLGVCGLNISHTVPSGVVVQYNTFGPPNVGDARGCADGFMINGGAYFVTVQFNEFRNMRETTPTDCSPTHLDPFQFFGGVAPQVIGNYFHGNSTGIMSGDCNGGNAGLFADNIFLASQSPSGGSNPEYGDQIVQSGDSNSVYNHNTFVNAQFRFGYVNCGLNSNLTLTNNLAGGSITLATFGQATQSTASFTMDRNASMGLGTNQVAGTPTYTGGSAPTTRAGFALTSGSIGHLAASDGTDIGSRYALDIPVGPLAP